MKVREFMSTKMEFLEANRSVYDAIEKMVDRRLRFLVIHFPGQAEEHGLITTRDIVFRVLAKGLDPKVVKAAEIASKPIFCVDQAADFHEVTNLMESSNIARIFVCEDRKIVGVVSLLDVMAATLIMRARGDNVS